MTEPVFPTLPGLGWSVLRSPKFSTRIQKAISGRELRVLDQPYPIWTWTLVYNILRDAHDTRGGNALGTGFDELRTLAGFFLQMQGAFQSFLFDDPSDDTVTGQALGIGNGSFTVFQLLRSFGPGGAFEPITAPHVVSHVYVDGIDPGGWTVDPLTGLVTMGSAPAGGTAITADFTYYFRVRFVDDAAEFENFLYQLWSLKQIKFESTLA
jgi:uncharacterized protein (TIGR02217 family)